MYSFNVHRPKSIDEATKLFAGGSDARYLAGGQSLIAALKMRLAQPSDLIDLGGINELRSIKVEAGKITIGAMATHASVAASKDVQKAIPALATLADGIGDRQIRNAGTLGGALANDDPAACYPAAVLALGATINTNKRAIAADDFFKGMYETALAPGELVTSVAFPVPQRAAYQKFQQPASRFALVGVFIAQAASGVRCAVTGAAPSVFRATAIEQALSKRFEASALDGITIAADNLNADIHASAQYRAHLIKVLAQRAVAGAIAT
jgi:aerobic carbon-monoxide dehydrogenase medium subunit